MVQVGVEDKVKKLAHTLKYIKYSPLSPGKPIMSDNEAVTLTNYLKVIHDHLKNVHDPRNENPKFAIDVEWKIDKNEKGERAIYIKQARPYVD